MLANAVQIQISNFQLWPAVDSDDTIRVVMAGVPHQNPAGCVDPDSYFVPTTYTAPIKARIYATLLTAVAMKKSVTDGGNWGDLYFGSTDSDARHYSMSVAHK